MMGCLAKQHTIGLILDNDPIALSSALRKNEIGLIWDNDPIAMNSSAEQIRNQ
jgi:hypothetical protein